MTNNSLKSTAVVVVGGGFGGLTTALSLSSCKERPPIILIEPRSRFVFLPLLYELLSGELQSWEVAPDYRTLLSAQGIVLIEQYVENIDLIKKEVCTSNGEKIPYGQLVLSTGSKPNSMGIQGVHEYSLMFNKYEDVFKIKKLISRLNNSKKKAQNLLIVGAGPTGVELACKISDLLEDHITLHLIELGDRVLPLGKSFNQEQIEQALRRKSISLHLNTRVEKIFEKTIEIINLASNKDKNISLSHQGVIWTAGIYPSIPNGIPNNLFQEGKVLINSQLQVLGCENIFAIGDIALDIENPYPSNAQVAMQQGEHLAKNLIYLRKREPLTQFEFIDRGEMLSMGVGDATITAMGVTISGPIAFQMRRIAYLSKFPNLSLSIRSAGAWLLSYRKKLI